MSNIVDDHRKMLIFSGNLSEFQLKNLKTWPFIVFDNLTEVIVNFDMGSDRGVYEAGKVSYTFKFSEKPEKEVKERAERDLTNWVKFLFWKETEVEFKYD